MINKHKPIERLNNNNTDTDNNSDNNNNNNDNTDNNNNNNEHGEWKKNVLIVFLLKVLMEHTLCTQKVNK